MRHKNARYAGSSAGVASRGSASQNAAANENRRSRSVPARSERLAKRTLVAVHRNLINTVLQQPRQHREPPQTRSRPEARGSFLHVLSSPLATMHSSAARLLRIKPVPASALPRMPAAAAAASAPARGAREHSVAERLLASDPPPNLRVETHVSRKNKFWKVRRPAGSLYRYRKSSVSS